MPRSLPAGLAARITATGQQPELSVTVQDLVERLQLLAQSSNPPGRSAALLSSTGMILRAVVENAGTSGPLYVQRIDPTDPTAWTAHGVQLSAAVTVEAGAALAQTGSVIRCFYQRHADLVIVYRDSSNDGLTWGAETALLPTLDPFCSGIAAASITDLWITTYTFPQAANIIWRSTYSGSWSAWSNVGPSTPLWTQVRGLAVSPTSPDVFTAGVALRGYSSGISAASCTFDGAAYSAWQYIQQLDSPAAGLSCAFPDVFFDGSTYYAVVTLTDDGSVSTSGHTRTTIYTSPDGLEWSFHLAAGSSLEYGAHLIIAGGVTYVFDSVICYTVPPAPDPIDLSDDVLSLEISERYNEPSTLALLLSNNNGQYTGAPWLSDNVTLTIALGYGGDTVLTHTFYLDDWQLNSSATEQSLSIAARDSLKLLDYPSTQLRVWSNDTIPEILTDIYKQNRLEPPATPATPQFSQAIGCFLINPGETWLSALNRLANVFGFIYLSDGDASASIIDPLITDTEEWEYGSEVLAAQLGNESNQANVVRVTGATTDPSGIPTWAEATDPNNILAVGAERYRNVVDRILTTSDQCLIRASQEIRAEQRTSIHAHLLVALNPAHQLADVITATDSGCGMSASRSRISGMTWIARPAGQIWEHHLNLEAP